MLSWLRKLFRAQDDAHAAAPPGAASAAPDTALSTPDPGGMTAPGEPPHSPGTPHTGTGPSDEPPTGGDDLRQAPPPAETVPSGSVHDRVVEALKSVFDPEIPVNIYELGLIYGVALDDAGKVAVQMTLTSPNCPEAQSLPAEVEYRLKETPGVSDASVEIVWEPPWGPERMSEAAKLELGM